MSDRILWHNKMVCCHENPSHNRPTISCAFSDALESIDRDAFISEWAMSSLWGDSEGHKLSAKHLNTIGVVWDAAHTTIRDIRSVTGLSQAGFGIRFCIPCRTIEDWEAGRRSCPGYIRLLLMQAVGLLQR